MAGFADLPISARMRQVMRRIALRVLNEERPVERLAEVTSIDADAWLAYVLYPGETESVPIRMGAVMYPTEVGQKVLVGGQSNSRRIVDVLGMPPA